MYDVAFEGLIKNVERRYRETGSETMKAEYETFMNINSVFCLRRSEAEARRPCRYSRRKEYRGSNIAVHRKASVVYG